MFQIGGASQAAGLSIDTLRYYEKIGLLEKAIRSSGGFRLYSQETIEKLRFIKKAQALGLTLGEIKEIMVCSEEGLKSCCDLVRTLFAKKIGEFDVKIKGLEKMKRRLEKKILNWVSPEKAKRQGYAVCPQIEKEPGKRS
ncbi:MAG: MerR family transcriptional regulator [Chlamydiae bacterium]|nr:MerR family transcriptional regulator [Chlamydiota bacterium]